MFTVLDWGTVGETWSGGAVFHDPYSGEQKSVYHFHQLVHWHAF